MDQIYRANGLAWGTIPRLKCENGQYLYEAGEILVPVGDISHGFNHIKEKHIKNINKHHPDVSIEEYILHIFNFKQRIYHQKNGTLWLLCENGMRKCAVVAPCILDKEIYYKLITAYPLPREPNMTDREAILAWF